MKRTFIALLICIASSSGLAAADEPQGKTTRIGVVFGLTGAAQVWSEFGRMGLELAQEEINRKGIKGGKIELVFEDSRSVPSQSVSAYNKLKTVEQVKIVIGDIWSYLINPLIPLAKADNLILFSPTAMPESIALTNDNFFSMGERISSVRSAVDHFFRINPEVKKIGIFCWEDTWGQAYLKVWREVAEANGVKVEAAICISDFTNDFKTDVAKISARKVDAVVIAHFGDVILKRLREQRFSGKVLATSNVVEDIKVKLAPKELFEGVFVTDWRPSEEFINKFKARFKKEPVVEAHNSYETLLALSKALSSDESDLLKALKGMKYQGVAGPIDFSQSPFVNLSIAKLYRVYDGELRLVE